MMSAAVSASSYSATNAKSIKSMRPDYKAFETKEKLGLFFQGYTVSDLSIDSLSKNSIAFSFMDKEENSKLADKLEILVDVEEDKEKVKAKQLGRDFIIELTKVEPEYSEVGLFKPRLNVAFHLCTSEGDDEEEKAAMPNFADMPFSMDQLKDLQNMQGAGFGGEDVPNFDEDDEDDIPDKEDSKEEEKDDSDKNEEKTS